MATDAIHPTGLETVTPIVGEFIVSTPGTCNGEPRIAGTRVKVRHVSTWVEEAGMTPAQVVAAYPHLSMAQVHAALAHHWSHRDEIHADIACSKRLVETMMEGVEISILA